MLMGLRSRCVAAAAVAVLAACDATGESSLAQQYDLRFLAGRPLPSAFINWPQWPPADSQFPAITAARIRFLSDSSLQFELRQEAVVLHADGSISSLGSGNCWSGNGYRYAKAGDRYALTPLPGQPNMPPVPATFRVDARSLTGFTTIADTVFQWGFLESDSPGSVCDGFGE